MSFFWILILIGIILLIPTAYAAKIGAPYVPAPRRIIRKALAQLDIGAEDVVVDLGAGDGNVLLAAAAQGASAIGYELSPIMWLVVKLRTLGKKRIKLIYKNFYKASLNEATIVFAFLMPDNMGRVKKFLAQQSIPYGKYLVVYAFPLPDTDPLQIIREKNCSPIYVYNLKDLTKK